MHHSLTRCILCVSDKFINKIIIYQRSNKIKNKKKTNIFYVFRIGFGWGVRQRICHSFDDNIFLFTYDFDKKVKMAFHATELIFDSHFGYGFNGISNLKRNKMKSFVNGLIKALIPIEIVRLEWQYRFIDKNENETQKTLFHYKHRLLHSYIPRTCMHCD